MKRIVVVGAGFAGVWAALAARRRIAIEGSDAAVAVTLVAPEPVLTIRPRLYEADPGAMVVPLQALLSDAGIAFVAGTARAIDSDRQRLSIAAADGGRADIAYDRLVLAAGSRLVRPPIPGLADHAFSVDQLVDAVALDTHLRGLAATAGPATIVVIGGGFTGIELAAELPGRLRAIRGDAAQTRVILVEGAKTLADACGDGAQAVIARTLARHGVEVRTGRRVAAIDADGVTLAGGGRIDAAAVIFTGGVRASALAGQLDTDIDDLGRVKVDRFLRAPRLPDIFLAGDTAMAATDDDGHMTTMSCQHAIFSGKRAGDNAAADVLGQAMQPYRQPDYVTCIALGTDEAVFTRGWDRQVALEGAAAGAMKAHINRRMIYPPIDAAQALAAAAPADSPLR